VKTIGEGAFWYLLLATPVWKPLLSLFRRRDLFAGVETRLYVVRGRIDRLESGVVMVSHFDPLGLHAFPSFRSS
jgi:hypothetical protein